MTDIDIEDLPSIEGGNPGECLARDIGNAMDAMVLGSLFSSLAEFFCP